MAGIRRWSARTQQLQHPERVTLHRGAVVVDVAEAVGVDAAAGSAELIPHHSHHPHLLAL